MAKLTEIIKVINTSIADVLTDKRFGSAKYFGITSLRHKGEGQMPFEFDLDAEGKYVGIDDVHSAIIYHRYNNSQFLSDANATATSKKQAHNMSMYVYFLSNKIKLHSDDMEGLIVSGVPFQLSSQNLQDFNLKGCVIKITGSEHNTLNILSREYQGQQIRLDPNLILFEIKYTIECKWDKRCINTLCC